MEKMLHRTISKEKDTDDKGGDHTDLENGGDNLESTAGSYTAYIQPGESTHQHYRQ